MKKFVIMGVILNLLALPFLLEAADPTNTSVTSTEASNAIDSQHTGTWQLIDSNIVLKDDSCDTYYHVEGTITLHPGQKFYLAFVDGLSHASALTADMLNIKTYQLPVSARQSMSLTIGNVYLDSLRSQTDVTDSIYVYCAVLGSNSNVDRVTITSMRLTGTVINMD